MTINVNYGIINLYCIIMPQHSHSIIHTLLLERTPIIKNKYLQIVDFMVLYIRSQQSFNCLLQQLCLRECTQGCVFINCIPIMVTTYKPGYSWLLYIFDIYTLLISNQHFFQSSN